jgi:hypothetical protein
VSVSVPFFDPSVQSAFVHTPRSHREEAQSAAFLQPLVKAQVGH